MLALVRLWREADSSGLRQVAAWAFSTQPLLSRDTFAVDAWGDCDAWLEQLPRMHDPDEEYARFVLAWYRRSPWDDSELAEKVSETGVRATFRPTAREMLATLGEDGRRVLEKWDAKEKK